MADSINTLRELLSGYNNMQATLGLTPTSGQAQGFQGGMTPAPQIKHPGEFSVEIVSRASQQAGLTMQAGMMPRQMPAPGVLGLTPGGAPVSPPPQQGGMAGQFASQYGAQMRQIQGQYLTPYQAQFYAGAAGQEGFQNLPSPAFMTQPSMGIFRPTPPPPPPIQMARDRPFIITPFTHRMPAPQFMPAREMRYQQGVGYDEDIWASGMGAVPTAARLGMGGMGMMAGASFGAGAAMSMFGRGAGLGRVGGMLGGAALGFGALGGMAERGMEFLTQPIVQTRAFGRQLEALTQPNVIGGPDVNAFTGRGLSTRAGVGLANQMQGMVGRGDTAGFNMRDMMRMTGMAADTGMLDMAQSGEQIANTMRNIARGISSFMRIAQEPDLRRAMQQMSSMRTMGLTIPETTIAVQNAQTFSRMAGTSVQGIMQAGMPGAMTFQNLGMTAGLGMQVGMGAQAYARQAVAGGAFTPAQLAMAGGTSGIQQTLTEAAGAGLGVNFPVAAMLSRNAQGQFAVDSGKLNQLMSGQLSMSQQAAMASQNVSSPKAILELSTRMNELRDEMGRALGPNGALLYTMTQAQQLRSQIPGMTFGGALQMMGMAPQQARTVEIMGQDKGFWGGLRRQSQLSIERARDDERERIDQLSDQSSWSSQFQRSAPMRLAKEGWRNLSDVFSSARGGIAQLWTGREEQSRAAAYGGAYVRTPASLTTENRRFQKAIRDFAGTADFGGGLRGGRGGDQDLSTGEIGGALWNVGSSIGSMAVGGPLGGIAAGLGASMLGSNAPANSTYVQSLRAQGGLSGAFANMLPSAAVLGLSQLPPEMRKKVIAQQTAQAEDAAQGALLFSRGETLTSAQMDETRKAIRGVFGESERAFGKGTGKGGAGFDDRTESAIVSDLIRLYKDNSGGLTNKATAESAQKKTAIEAMVRLGHNRGTATQIINSHWGTHLGPLLLQRVGAEGGPDVAGSIAAGQTSLGFLGFKAGKNLQDTISNLEDANVRWRRSANLITGEMGEFGASMSSEKTVKEFQELLGTTPDDEVALMQAQALRSTSKNEGDAQEVAANQIEERLRGRLGQGGMDKLRKAVAGRGPPTDNLREALTRSGMVSAHLTDPSAYIKTLREQTLEIRGSLAIGKRVAQLREQGVAFEGVGQGANAFGVEKIEKSLETLTSTQISKLTAGEQEAVKAFQNAKTPEEKRKAALQFRKELTGDTGTGTSTVLGGKGVGGRTEARERQAQSSRDALEKAIGGGEDGDDLFAKAAPVFADSVEHFSTVVNKVEDVGRKIANMNNVPWAD